MPISRPSADANSIVYVLLAHMTKRQKIIFLVAIVIVLASGAVLWRGLVRSGFPWANDRYSTGIAVEGLDGVAVYDNGPKFEDAHGRNYASDGYYFGQKWQCVEFIKRYLYQAKGLRMPDVWGNAISFFDPDVAHGALNSKRGMIQFRQGGDEPPRRGDLIVFGGAAGYGHVAIIANVDAMSIEVVQQNMPPARERLVLRRANGGYVVDGRLPPLGWLRLPDAALNRS